MDEFTLILQSTLAPIALISGVGLLLLSLVNRYNQALTRTRAVLKERKNCRDRGEKDVLDKSIAILFARCKILKTSVWFIGIGIVFSSAIVWFTAMESIFQFSITRIKEIMLLFSISAVLISTVLFVIDISYSLKAIRLEIESQQS
ncbi:MAG: DUF2721 domain-containing protein [bacterium]|jgi:hypothetical protein